MWLLVQIVLYSSFANTCKFLSPAMPPRPSPWSCDCQEKCKGVARPVSQSTFRKHKEYRQRDMREKFALLLANTTQDKRAADIGQADTRSKRQRHDHSEVCIITCYFAPLMNGLHT
jgi:hypothetical protein